MKKLLTLLLTIALVAVLAACGGNNDKKDNNNTGNNNGNNDNTNEAANNNNDAEPVQVVIGASSVPHAEILEEAQPILAEQGVDLVIEQYEDYILPNDDLANGTLDANYFQHIPYLEETNANTGYDLTHIGGVHIEPMGIFSQDIESIDAVEDGTEVVLSNSVAEHGRVLGLLQAAGLITLDDSVEVQTATLDDITENPKNLKFSPDYDPVFLPEIYNSEADVLVVINGNYAIGAGLDPVKDSLFLEGAESVYVNVLAVKQEDKGNEALQTVLDVLRSEEIQTWIEEKYEGSVIPVSE